MSSGIGGGGGILLAGVTVTGFPSLTDGGSGTNTGETNAGPGGGGRGGGGSGGGSGTSCC